MGHPADLEPRAGWRGSGEELLLDLPGDPEPDLHALLLGPAALLGEPMFHLPALVLAEQFGLPPDLLPGPMELHEHSDLGPKHLGHDRLEQKVHRPDGVAPEHVRVGALVGGQEDDRSVPRAVALPDQVGELEAVHAGHLDVHQDQREVVAQQPAQRLDAGAGPDEVLTQLAQRRLEDEEVAGRVVDHEDVDLRLGRHGLYSSSG